MNLCPLISPSSPFVSPPPVSPSLSLSARNLNGCIGLNTIGRALDGVVGLPLLSALDLSYNTLEVDSLLAARPATPPKLSRGELRARGGAMPQASGARDEVQSFGSSSPRIDGGSLDFHGKFAAVEHLDLSWNCLCDLDQLVRVLRQGCGGSCEITLMMESSFQRVSCLSEEATVVVEKGSAA